MTHRPVRDIAWLVVTAFLASATADRANGQDAPVAQGGYLFAHMTKRDYGRLYYAVSTDGLHWRTLNAGKRILDDYRGHPDICRGHDGRHYLIGNYERKPDIHLWVSSDLVTWKKFGSFRPDLRKVPNFRPALLYLGAPKLYYDAPSKRYLVTWHSTEIKPDPHKPEAFWSGMRTLYVTSKDLKTFSQPRRLFDFDMATIDVIVRREGTHYYALIKDERYPSFDWPTGKTIRISSAKSLLGPYSQPGPPVTPNFREAPTVVPRPDGKGWYLYYEQYPGVSYDLSTAPGLSGPWHSVWCIKYQAPAGARHGCIVTLTKREYDAILKAYGKGE